MTQIPVNGEQSANPTPKPPTSGPPSNLPTAGESAQEFFSESTASHPAPTPTPATPAPMKPPTPAPPKPTPPITPAPSTVPPKPEAKPKSNPKPEIKPDSRPEPKPRPNPVPAGNSESAAPVKLNFKTDTPPQAPKKPPAKPQVKPSLSATPVNEFAQIQKAPSGSANDTHDSTIEAKLRKTGIFVTIGLIILGAGAAAYYFISRSAMAPEDLMLEEELASPTSSLESPPAANPGSSSSGGSSVSGSLSDASVQDLTAPETPTETEAAPTLTDSDPQFQLNIQDTVPVNGTDSANLFTKITEQQTKLILPAQFILSINSTLIDLAQLKQTLNIAIPPQIGDADTRFAFLMAKENGIIKAGLALEHNQSPETVKNQMLEWEKTMVGDLKPLLFDQPANDPADPEDFRFKESAKFPNGRFISLSQSQDLSLDYSILTDKIVICTSYPMLEKIMPALEKE